MSDPVALALVAPAGGPIPDSLDDVLGLMDDPIAPWGILGTVEYGSVEQSYEPYRLHATLVTSNPERFRIVGRPSRLAIVDRDPADCSLRGMVWPVATLHPVDPARVRSGDPLRVSFDVSAPDYAVSYGDPQSST